MLGSRPVVSRQLQLRHKAVVVASCCAPADQIDDMIQWFMLQNRAGKTRLSKFYEPHTDEDKRKVEHETFRTLSTRDSKWANFCEVRHFASLIWRCARLLRTRRTRAAAVWTPLTTEPGVPMQPADARAHVAFADTS